ncbi:hypothetical protein EMN47_07510 [Prolixibacteraceae bacterium JC049]|nr:hypothetical protein [Prolixibacteraceae bacterium JC049]
MSVIQAQHLKTKKMKNLIFTIALLFAFHMANANYTSKSDTVIIKSNDAQIIESKDDKTKVRIGGNLLVVEKDEHGNSHISILDRNKRKNRSRRFYGHWKGFEIGTNFMMDGDFNTLNNTNWKVKIPRSLEVNFNLTQANLTITRHWGMVTGFGLTFNDFHFANDVTIDKMENGKVEFIPVKEEEYPGLKKTKFSAGYVTVPLLMEFQIPRERTYFSFGVEGGINFTSHTKIKSSKGKEKDWGSFNLKPFRASAVVRLGIKDIKIFAKYSLTNIFEDRAGQIVHPFSIGFSFN